MLLFISAAGLCQFINVRGSDDFDWTRDRGGTPSSQTGPSADHTQGNQNGRHIDAFFFFCHKLPGAPKKLTRPKFREVKSDGWIQLNRILIVNRKKEVVGDFVIF